MVTFTKRPSVLSSLSVNYARFLMLRFLLSMLPLSLNFFLARIRFPTFYFENAPQTNGVFGTPSFSYATKSAKLHKHFRDIFPIAVAK